MTSPISYPLSVAASSPAAESDCPDNNGADLNSVTLRPMRLKILYTFDDENKTNCLARWPHVLDVQTVYLDETTAIGVIELKTCIQAIVSASPELVAKLGQDYTVYAYDYSEYDTPLVGQGMLSWALASASPTPGAPAHQSRTMITGRVCKNLLGLFSNGVKETLEVKLRLVSVPTCLQSEYLQSMERYRELSSIMPTGFDQSAWQAFLLANPQIAEGKTNVGTSKNYTSMKDQLSENASTGMELLGQLLEQGLLPEHVVQTLYRSPDQVRPLGFVTRSSSIRLDELGFNRPSPSATVFSAAPPAAVDQSSRPASRASMKAPPTSAVILENAAASKLHVRDRADQVNNTDHEDGPTKKRARVTRTKWSGKSTLESNAESLRIAASTAASMRMYRPIAINPSLANEVSEEGPERAPTPRPDKMSAFHRRTASVGGSGLGREAMVQINSIPGSPTHSARSVFHFNESNVTSPDDYREGSAIGTPLEIASSPPMREVQQSIPSSPVLPILPRQNIDSGFMSGNVDEIFEAREERGGVQRQSNYKHLTRPYKAIQTPQHEPFAIEEVIPGPPELLPTRILPRPPQGQRYGIVRAQSLASSEVNAQSESGQGPSLDKSKRARQPRVPPKTRAPLRPTLSTEPAKDEFAPQRIERSRKTLTRTPSIGKMVLPPVAASDPAHGPSHLCGSELWPGPEHAMSDAPGPQYILPAPSKKPEAPPKLIRNGSGVKRRQAIQKRLAAAIRSGETPPYCENCGSIETPTWRKSWMKSMLGAPDAFQVSDEEGGIFAIIENEKDKDNNVIAYSILKKSITEEEQDFNEVQLCNPCGLWLYKFRNMRPQERWSKGVKETTEKKSRPPRKRATGFKRTEASASEAETSQDLPRPAPDANQPIQLGQTEESYKVGDEPPVNMQSRVTNIYRSTSAERNSNRELWTDAAATAALNRAIQSSPARRLGIMRTPINADDLGTTRRLLFPSPHKPSETPSRPPRFNSITQRGNMLASVEDLGDQKSPSLSEHLSPDQSDKENRPPSEENHDVHSAHSHGDDDIWKLFDDPPSPTTPNRPHPVQSHPKTPAHRTPTRTHPMSTRKTPLGGFSSTGKDHLLPPRTPSTRTRSRSPVSTFKRRGGGPIDPVPSPFTIHLQNLLSEAYISPNRQTVDLRSIPALEDLWPTTSLHSGSGTGDQATCARRLLDPDDVFSTDVIMPSSPPILGNAGPFFNLYEDLDEGVIGLWGDFDLSNHGLDDSHGIIGVEQEANPRADEAHNIGEEVDFSVLVRDELLHGRAV